MAACTLDDLVPSFKCNRIFLESATGNYEEYQVMIDASVHDTVEDDSGIADYLLSDTFKNNVQLFVVFSRDERVRNFADFLDSYWNPVNKIGISPAKQSLLFQYMTQKASIGFLNNFDIVYEEFLSFYSGAFNSTSIARNNQFIDGLEDHYLDIKSAYRDGLLETKSIMFSEYSNELIKNYGDFTFDDDGNRFYDFKIIKEDLSFTNKTEVEFCYMHSVCFFNASSLIDGVQIPVNSETIEFFYKDIDECRILEDGMAASSKVQDFRLTERIQEIIRPDRISDYDQVIDQVSLATGNQSSLNSGITSDMYSSYVHNDDGEIRTHNRFYLNIRELCRRNSSAKFIYDNLLTSNSNAVLSDFEVLSTRVYRVRKDSFDVTTLQDTEVLISTAKLTNDIIYYEVSDISFENLTDGEYTYKLEIDFLDPIFIYAEKFIDPVKTLLSRFNQAITYIHNNPQNYNELRDELNAQAQSDLRQIFPPDNQLFVQAFATDELFKALTGKLYSSLANSEGFTDISDISTFERRKLENMKRIIEDLLFAAGRYFPTAAINNESANAAKNQNKVLTYSRTWDINVSPDAFKYGVVAIVPPDTVAISESEYEARMDLEKQNHNVPINIESKNLGFATPSSLSGIDPYSSEDIVKKYLNIFANILERGDIVDDGLSNALLNTNPEGYDGTINELKNGSGMFESFLTTMGGTIENNTIDSIDTKIDIPKISKKRYSSGIDNGENLLNSVQSNYGTLEIITDDDLEKIEEKRDDIKQSIFFEKVKIEDVVMRMLINRDGYSMLDRKSFIQGEKNSRSFDYNFNYSSNVAEKPHPILHFSTEKYFRYAKNGKGSEVQMPLSRFILDNTFMVFYLAGLDENMNPDWRQLTDIENARSIANNVSNQTGGVLCKFKRFQNSKIQIGQGSTSDREILSRYFYLKLD